MEPSKAKQEYDIYDAWENTQTETPRTTCRIDYEMWPKRNMNKNYFAPGIILLCTQFPHEFGNEIAFAYNT